MYNRRFRRRPQAPNNAIDEGRQLAGLGDLSEDLMRQRGPRPPILSPRGVPGGRSPSDDPLSVPLGPLSVPPAMRGFNPQALSTYSVPLAAGVAIQVYAGSRERSYSIIINSGANDCVITYGRPPVDATDGIPLAASGVGFHELIHGTTSTVWAFAAAATTLTITEGRYDPAMET